MRVLWRVLSSACCQAWRSLSETCAAVADDADAHAVAGELGEVLRDRDEHQAHQAGDLLARPLPVLGREREHGQVLDAAVGAGVHRAHERVDALLVAEEARHVPLLGPAAVAVHDDGDVARHAGATCGTLAHQTAMISASLAEVSRSISAMVRSVSFCSSSSERRSSSSVIGLVLEQLLGVLVGVAAQVADGDLGVLAGVARRPWSAPCGAPR